MFTYQRDRAKDAVVVAQIKFMKKCVGTSGNVADRKRKARKEAVQRKPSLKPAARFGIYMQLVVDDDDY